MPLLAAMRLQDSSSVHSNAIDCGSSRVASRSISSIPCPVLTPGATLPLIAAAGYML